MIKTLKSFVDYLSHLGVTPDLALEKRKNVLLSNQFALTWIGVTLPYLIIFAIYDPPIIYFLAAIFSSHFLTFIFNGNRLYNVARMVESIIPQVTIFFIGALWYTHPQDDKFTIFYMLNLAFLVIPFMVFSMKEFIYIAICVFISIIAGLTLDMANQAMRLESSSAILTTRWFEIFNYFIAASFLMIGFSYMKKSNEYYQREISSLLGETTLKNKQLEHQKNAITEQRDEIQAQRDEILEQKERLEDKQGRLEKQRDLIYNQNKEITDSINYARHIQQALLPPYQELKELFSECFVFNRPYAVVSGDFYWVEKKGNRIYIVVGDCTGHGVPGGFLSMLGMAYLTEIVNKHHAIEAHEILNELKNMFIRSLRQTNKEEIHFDGIDIALCVIDKDNKKIFFSGAFNSLYIVRDKRLLELKGDRMPIGFYLGESDSFGQQEIDIINGDRYYLFTDGYISQPGEEEGRKLNKSRFKQLLLDISHLSLAEQCVKLETYLIEWIGEYDQMDDILVMGFSVG